MRVVEPTSFPRLDVSIQSNNDRLAVDGGGGRLVAVAAGYDQRLAGAARRRLLQRNADYQLVAFNSCGHFLSVPFEEWILDRLLPQVIDFADGYNAGPDEAMNDERKQQRTPTIVVTLAAVLVFAAAYVLSIGPMLWLATHGYLSDGARQVLSRAYEPLWVFARCIPFLNQWLLWYVGQWD